MPALATEKDLFLDHFAQYDNRWADAPFARLRQCGPQSFPRPELCPASKRKTGASPTSPACGRFRSNRPGEIARQPRYNCRPMSRMTPCGSCSSTDISLLVSKLSDLPPAFRSAICWATMTDQAEKFLGKSAEYGISLSPP